MGEFPRPYSDVDFDDPVVHSAIEQALENADVTGKASIVRCVDGRELIVPPQPVRRDEEESLRRSEGNQSFYAYGIFQRD